MRSALPAPGAGAAAGDADPPEATISFSIACAFSAWPWPRYAPARPRLASTSFGTHLRYCSNAAAASACFWALSRSAPWLNAERFRIFCSVVSVTFALAATALPIEGRGAVGHAPSR